jgi:hypothetical protein
MTKQVKILVSLVIALIVVAGIAICIVDVSSRQKPRGQVLEERKQVLSLNLRSSFGKNLVGKSPDDIRGMFGDPPVRATGVTSNPSSFGWTYYDTDSNSYLLMFEDGVVVNAKVVPPVNDEDPNKPDALDSK